MELRVPDRVPFTPFCTFYPARHAGLSFQDAMYDLDRTEKAIERFTLDLQPDMCPDTFRILSWAAMLEALDYRQLKWPGHGLGPNAPYQFVEGEYMRAEEYDDFILDPTGFLLGTIFPRIYGAAVYWFEQTDVFRAKEILGDRICIRGNVPASLLCTGTPEEVKAYCVKLIEKVGKGGGFILDGGIGIPDEAGAENVRAMASAVRECGTYS